MHSIAPLATRSDEERRGATKRDQRRPGETRGLSLEVGWSDQERPEHFLVQKYQLLWFRYTDCWIILLRWSLRDLTRMLAFISQSSITPRVRIFCISHIFCIFPHFFCIPPKKISLGGHPNILVSFRGGTLEHLNGKKNPNQQGNPCMLI